MIIRTSVRLFGGLTEPYLGYLDTLKTNLKKAKMKISVHEYICLLLFSALLAFVVFLTLGSFFICMFVPPLGYCFLLSVIIALTIPCVVILWGYYYPSLKAAGIKKEINKSLPFAAFYMTTTASSGANPVEIFRVLSLKKGVLGEEAQKIYRSVKTLGLNLVDVLQRAATNTASPEFADLLWGMISVITAGGNLEEYLKTKTEALMGKYRRMLNDYAKAITLYTEIYITLIVVGSLLFIILTAIMSPLTGMGVMLIQTFLVFFFIPLVSMGFIVLLKSISPVE
jgi:archaellum biogenesis protein FlaJ (TadC family)